MISFSALGKALATIGHAVGVVADIVQDRPDRYFVGTGIARETRAAISAMAPAQGMIRQVIAVSALQGLARVR